MYGVDRLMYGVDRLMYGVDRLMYGVDRLMYGNRGTDVRPVAKKPRIVHRLSTGRLACPRIASVAMVFVKARRTEVRRFCQDAATELGVAAVSRAGRARWRIRRMADRSP